MTAALGIGAFIVSLLFTYLVIPFTLNEPLSTAVTRLIITVGVTWLVSVSASRIVQTQRSEKEEDKRLGDEQERRARQRQDKHAREAQLERESHKQRAELRAARLGDAQQRVSFLKQTSARRGQQAKESALGPERFEYGVVTDLRLAQIVANELNLDRAVVSVAQMAELTTELVVSYDQYLENLEGLQYADNLSALSLRSVDNLAELEPLARLRGLRRLSLVRLPRVSEIDALACHEDLEDLTLGDLSGVTDFRPLAGLAGLKRIKLASLSESLELETLAGITGLTTLELFSMKQFGDLHAVADLSGLTTLGLHSVGPLEDLALLARLPRLTSLVLHGSRIDDLAPIGQLSGLKSLELWDVWGGDPMRPLDLEPLSSLSGLTSLVLDNVHRGDDEPWKELDLSPLQHLTSLTRLRLRDHYRSYFNDLRPISRLARLENLDLHLTETPRDVDPLAIVSGLARLSELSLRGHLAYEPDLSMLHREGLKIHAF